MANITKQIKGIDVTLDPEVLQDYEVLMLLTKTVSDPGKELTPEESIESMKAMDEIAHIIYGKKFDGIKKKLRTANGGKLPVELVAEFIGETFTEFQKNS